jgi:chromosome segregation ATPase
MKTNALLAIVVAGAMTFTACNKKIDEKTMADINQFGTDWSTLGEKASTWSKQLAETAQHAKEVSTKQTEMWKSMSTSKDEAMKTKMQEMSKAATENSASFDAMMNDWNSYKTTWEANTKAFTEWQGKVTKGEVTPEEATKGITDWKTKMNEAQQKIDNWNTAYNSAKESCDKNMASLDEISKSMTTPSHTETKVTHTKK